MFNKTRGSTAPSEGQAREKLALYVYEYLLHAGAAKAAQMFLNEIHWDKAVTLGDPPGFLHSWWCVFWDLYCAAPERRESCEHSNEAKAFHDYGFVHSGSHFGGGGPTAPPHNSGHMSMTPHPLVGATNMHQAVPPHLQAAHGGNTQRIIDGGSTLPRNDSIGLQNAVPSGHSTINPGWNINNPNFAGNPASLPTHAGVRPLEDQAPAGVMQGPLGPMYSMMSKVGCPSGRSPTSPTRNLQDNRGDSVMRHSSTALASSAAALTIKRELSPAPMSEENGGSSASKDNHAFTMSIIQGSQMSEADSVVQGSHIMEEHEDGLPKEGVDSCPSDSGSNRDKAEVKREHEWPSSTMPPQAIDSGSCEGQPCMSPGHNEEREEGIVVATPDAEHHTVNSCELSGGPDCASSTPGTASEDLSAGRKCVTSESAVGDDDGRVRHVEHVDSSTLAILKIKERMQEEAERFESTDERSQKASGENRGSLQ